MSTLFSGNCLTFSEFSILLVILGGKLTKTRKTVFEYLRKDRTDPAKKAVLGLSFSVNLIGSLSPNLQADREFSFPICKNFFGFVVCIHLTICTQVV